MEILSASSERDVTSRSVITLFDDCFEFSFQVRATQFPNVNLIEIGTYTLSLGNTRSCRVPSEVSIRKFDIFNPNLIYLSCFQSLKNRLIEKLYYDFRRGLSRCECIVQLTSSIGHPLQL